MERKLRGDEARDVAESLLRSYFRTQDYPFTRHHIESFDQFLSQDLPAILKAENPWTILQNPLGKSTQMGGPGEQRAVSVYGLKAEVFVGGLQGDQIYIGTPTVSLKEAEEIRILYPNEARLRNLTYGAMVQADIVIRITITRPEPGSASRFQTETIVLDPAADPATYGYLAKFPLFRMPIMLHSRYCVLHGKPQVFLQEVGECQYDAGGYFIVEGSEKVLVTRQEQAFNTLYITPQKSDPKVAIFSSISCLNPTTRAVKRVAFSLMRQSNTLTVSLPFVRAPVPLFVLFRAMGVQSDEDIVRTILPDPESAEARILEPMLHESILEAWPFLDTYSAVQFIKTMTKGFSEAHVLDILHNQLFIHVEDRPGARIAFLAECARRILRVAAGIDKGTDRDDIRNQRCLTSGVLTRMLFQGAYTKWKKAAILTLDKEYKFNASIYKDRNFLNLFQSGTMSTMFRAGMMTESIMRGFKGKWGDRLGEEKAGVLQALSRLSYMDFMSHCRRVVKDFDTGNKAPEPRRLHPSQWGYFCTNETPTGGSIGITKNLSILTALSTATEPGTIIQWLLTRGQVIPCDEITPETHRVAVPVFINAGIIGYTLRPQLLRDVLKALKWTGCLPASASVGFSIRERRIFVFLDEARPIRPLVHLGADGAFPLDRMKAAGSWRDLVMGTFPMTMNRGLYQSGFVDPLAGTEAPSLEEYLKSLRPYMSAVEYVDPYEANEAYVAMTPDTIQAESTHCEVHPSTILGLMTNMIPFPNHNQSPRNQLSCSQSKQGLSVYATNYPNRFDNQVHVLCYGEAPIVRTLYYDYVADGQMPYGQNLMVAIGSFTGYNQDDGILFNADSFQRGMFRSIGYRSYEAYEEDDELSKTRTRVGNPARIPGWTSLRAGVDYSKLDARGIIRVGEFVDETTVLVGRYMQLQNGEMRDASVTAQVWTTGRVEKVAVMVSPMGRALVKVRVVQDRVPELGDKFSTRHGQKGTIGMLVRAHDMPRTADGLVPDMIVNPHCMPSRMTMAQLLESLLGKAAAATGAIGNATAFMNTGSPAESIGAVLRDQFGMNPLGEDILYDGTAGRLIPSTLFMGNIYIMRLKHMTEDKWNARAEGRREQRTHQPTGGRGAQGGLRIGEMERDAITGHGIMDFTRESMMKRSDGYQTYICNGCGTIPIYNEAKRLFVCSMCDGPVVFTGDSATNLELLPPNVRSVASFSKVELPYAMKVLDQELSFFMNSGMRFITSRDLTKLKGPPIVELTADQQRAALSAVLPERVVPDVEVPELVPVKEEAEVRPEDLSAMGAVARDEEDAEPAAAFAPDKAKVLNAAVNAAVNAAISTTTRPGSTQAQVNAAAVNAAVNAAIAATNRVEGPTGAAAAAPPSAAAAQALTFTPVAPPGTAAPASAVPDLTPSLNTGPLAVEGLPPGMSEVDVDAEIPVQGGGGPGPQHAPVNVQTSGQPVLVVPLNVGGAPAMAPPAEYVQPPIGGAPATFAVDTSERVMNSMGLAAAAPRQQGGSKPRSRSGSTGSGGGGSSTALPSAPNVKVNVVKQS